MKIEGLLITRSAVRARPEEPLQRPDNKGLSTLIALEQKRTFDPDRAFSRVKRLTYVPFSRLTFCHRALATGLLSLAIAACAPGNAPAQSAPYATAPAVYAGCDWAQIGPDVFTAFDAGAPITGYFTVCEPAIVAGLALIGLGLVLATPLFAGQAPDILVSETGKLVGVSGPDGLASNAARPSSFVFSQWQTALRGVTHVPPVQVRGANPDQTADPAAKPNADSLDRLLRSAELQTSRFHCANRGVCAAVHAGVRIVAIDQAALIGAACDRADLVVISIPVYLDECRSGATLVTARTLRRTGSLAIRVQESQASSGFQASKAGSGAGNSTGAHFRIDAAVQGVIRPWTVQRYYEWRTGTFDLPG